MKLPARCRHRTVRAFAERRRSVGTPQSLTARQAPVRSRQGLVLNGYEGAEVDHGATPGSRPWATAALVTVADGFHHYGVTREADAGR